MEIMEVYWVLEYILVFMQRKIIIKKVCEIQQLGMLFLLIFLIGCSHLQVKQDCLLSNSISRYDKEGKNNSEISFSKYIEKGYIELGMNKDQVRASWGEPKFIRHNETADYDEIWVYVPNWKFKDKIFFYKGILVKTDPRYLVVSEMEGHGIVP